MTGYDSCGVSETANRALDWLDHARGGAPTLLGWMGLDQRSIVALHARS